MNKNAFYMILLIFHKTHNKLPCPLSKDLSPAAVQLWAFDHFFRSSTARWMAEISPNIQNKQKLNTHCKIAFQRKFLRIVVKNIAFSINEISVLWKDLLKAALMFVDLIFANKDVLLQIFRRFRSSTGPDLRFQN